MRHVLVLAAVLAPSVARADQCAHNSKAVADAARAYTKQSSWGLEFCEPCGDKAPGKAFELRTVESKDGRLLVNGAAIDLAYFYVKTGPDEFANVGVHAGCRPDRVSAAIVNGKPSGPPTSSNRLRPPPPPIRPRVQSPDELAGTWTVRLSTRATTCDGLAKLPPTIPPVQTHEVWTIAYAGAAFTITTSTKETFVGAAGPLQLGAYRHRLNPVRRETETMLDVSHAMKDRFYGTLVRAERRRGTTCLTVLDASGTLQPVRSPSDP